MSLIENFDEEEYKNQIIYMGGTSVATPLTAGITAMMMIIYKKMTNTKLNIPVSMNDDGNTINYGKSSDFVNYFLKNHTDPLKHEMMKAVGYGKINPMYYTGIGKIKDSNVNTITYDNIKEITQEDLTSINTITLDFDGKEIKDIFKSNYNNNYTTNNNLDKIAIINNKFYPLKPFEPFDLNFYPNLSYCFDDSIVKTIAIIFDNNANNQFNQINKNLTLDNSLKVNKIDIKKDNIFTIQFKTSFNSENRTNTTYFYSDDTKLFYKPETITYEDKNNNILYFYHKESLILSQSNISPIGLISSKVGMSNDYQDYQNNDYVFTLIVNNKKTKFYINANLVHESILRIPFLLSEIIFNQNYNFLIYNRILNEQEILQNTRYLLNEQN